MAIAPKTVLPHSELKVVAPERLWIVTGSLPKRQMQRNMVVGRLADGGLLIHSAIAMDERGMAALEALGRPAVVIVPNGFHRMDAAAYRERYPKAKLVCPAASRAAIEKVVPVDAACEEALPGFGVRFHAPAGVKPAELVYELPASDGIALVMTDLAMNVPGLPGLEGLMLHAFGPGPRFGVTRIAKLLLVRDKAAFRGWLAAMAARADLAAVIVAHGEPIVSGASAQLRAAAERL